MRAASAVIVMLGAGLGAAKGLFFGSFWLVQGMLGDLGLFDSLVFLGLVPKAR